MPVTSKPLLNLLIASSLISTPWSMVQAQTEDNSHQVSQQLAEEESAAFDESNPESDETLSLGWTEAITEEITDAGLLPSESTPRSLLSDSYLPFQKDPMQFLAWTPPRQNAELRPAVLLPQKRRIASEELPNTLFGDLTLSAEKLALLKRYKAALDRSNQESCNEFQKLKDEADFTLAPLAKIRFWTLCPTQVPKGETLSEITDPILQSLKLEAEMIHAERAEEWTLYLSLVQTKIAGMKMIREKVHALQGALQTAEFKGQTDYAKKFRADLERLAPRFIKNPKKNDFLAVGQDHIQAREFEKGRSYLRKVIASGQSLQTKRRAFQSIRNSYKVQQDKKTHLVEAEKFHRWLIDKKEWRLAYDSGIYWIRALWTEGQKSKAQKELTKLEKNFSSKTKVYDIEFIRGRMAEEDGNYTEALKYFELALEKGGKESPYNIRLEASKAWALLRLGRFQDAANEFANVAKISEDAPDRLRSQFWQAKALVKAGKIEESKAVFKQVAFDDPIGYYGLVAFHELSSSIPPLAQARSESLKGWDAYAATLPLTPNTASAPTPANPQSGSATPARKLTTEEKTKITELNFAGEKEVLQAYLDKISDESGWVWTSEEGLALLRSYAGAGLYLPLFATMGKIEPRQREDILLNHPELLFPRDYQNLIADTAEKEGIPKELPFSIIRQESAFNPKARSFADAMGLMQILPEQAARVAKSLKIPFKHHNDLYNPEINVPIGVRMLRQGLDRYKGNFILAIASYNANDRAIKNWLKTRFREDPVEFIEEIAYEETRGYVKLVLRNYIFYKRLENPSLALNFPEECLPGLQNFKHSESKEVVSR